MQPERSYQPEYPYQPKYPYLLYWLATLGWIVAVIEAMVAAPIIAYLYFRHKESKEPLKAVKE